MIWLMLAMEEDLEDEAVEEDSEDEAVEEALHEEKVLSMVADQLLVTTAEL